MDESQLLSILLESQVLTALHTLEAVEARVEIIKGLEARIKSRELENPLRDYIAEHPWLVSPVWDLFIKEQSVPNFVKHARERAKISELEGFKKRVDLVLSGNRTLLVLEFMRPNKTADFDHLYRFHTYVSIARTHITSSSAGDFDKIIGYLVADNLDRDAAVKDRILALEKEEMFCLDWIDLLERARRQWRHYFDVLVDRAPRDERIETIRQRQHPEENESQSEPKLVQTEPRGVN